MIENTDLLVSLLPEYTLRLGAAVLCGFVLGIERERKDKPAGLRTVILITVGAALFMIISDLIPVVTKGPESITRVDSSRVASQVVSGIGFLGAGAIIQARGAIHGLTTAATIWVSSGIGLCIGLGFPMLGGAITLLVLGVLVALDPLRTWLSRFGRIHTLELVVPNDSLTLRRIESTLRQHDGKDVQITTRDQEEETLHVTLTWRAGGRSIQRLIDALAHIEGVRGARYVERDR